MKPLSKNRTAYFLLLSFCFFKSDLAFGVENDPTSPGIPAEVSGNEGSNPEGKSGNLTIEEYLQNLSTVPGVLSRKDPFVVGDPPFEIPKTPTAEAPKVEVSGEAPIDPNAPVLERYPVKNYSVIAVLIGDQFPRALLRLPEAEKSKIVIVKLKDKLGNRGGRIAKVTREGLLIAESIKSPLGHVEKVETLLQIGAKAADKEKSAENTNAGNNSPQ